MSLSYFNENSPHFIHDVTRSDQYFLFFLTLCCLDCPSGWVRYGESCYFIDDTPTQSWSDARSTCQNMGGDLPIIGSAKENKFILSLIQKQDTYTALGAWIGFQRKADSKFYWVDGTSVEGQFTAWYRWEPDNFGGNENCGHMIGKEVAISYAGMWNDLNCNATYGDVTYGENNPVIVCQKPF